MIYSCPRDWSKPKSRTGCLCCSEMIAMTQPCLSKLVGPFLQILVRLWKAMQDCRMHSTAEKADHNTKSCLFENLWSDGIQWMLLVQTKTLPPWKLTWQWKLHHLSQCNFLLKLWIFQCHVSFPGCTLSVPFAHTSGSRNKPKESPAFVVNRGVTDWGRPDSSPILPALQYENKPSIHVPYLTHQFMMVTSWLDKPNWDTFFVDIEDFKWTYYRFDPICDSSDTLQNNKTCVEMLLPNLPTPT